MTKREQTIVVEREYTLDPTVKEAAITCARYTGWRHESGGTSF